jgi:hypothetical protein
MLSGTREKMSRTRVIGEVILASLTTAGGWYMFLLTLDVLPFPRFSIPFLILGLVGIAAMLSGMLFYGPMLFYDIWLEFKEEEEEELKPYPPVDYVWDWPREGEHDDRDEPV